MLAVHVTPGVGEPCLSGTLVVLFPFEMLSAIVTLEFLGNECP